MSEQQWVDHVIFEAGRGRLLCVPCGSAERLLDRGQLEAFLSRHARCQLVVSARRRFQELVERQRRQDANRPAPRSPPPRYDDVYLSGTAILDADPLDCTAPPASSRTPAD